MIFLNPVNKIFIHALKTTALIIILTTSNIVNATSVNVKIEDMGLSNWSTIEQQRPGFGSDGPVVLDWDPNNSFYTELLVWNNGYSGQGAAICWQGEDCALELSTLETDISITLESFSIGYYGYGGIVGYDVIDLDTSTSILTDIPWISGDESTLITVNSTSDTGFRILFGYDGFNGGINDISYSHHGKDPVLSSVPIPTTIWLFGSSLIGLIRFARQPTLV